MSASTEAGRVYLVVPFAEKEEAKSLGAKWDSANRAWFVPPGLDLQPFSQWALQPGAAIEAAQDPRQQFADKLRECGLVVRGEPIMDGRMHRVPVQGDDRGERSGAYVGHVDGWPAGFIQNHKTGLRTNWKADAGLSLGAEERARLTVEAAQKRHDREIERERGYEQAAAVAQAIWDSGAAVTAHVYLADKGVPSFGLREAAEGTTVPVERDDGPGELDITGKLLIPIRDIEGNLQSLQIISDDGSKMFMPGGRLEGGHFIIGDITQPGPLLMAEGYATGATASELTAMPAVVAFTAGNLIPVAEEMHERFPDRLIIIAGDNDHRRAMEGKPNVGKEKAEEAAALIGGYAVLPTFHPGERCSDWNDLAAIDRKAARLQLLTGIAIAEREEMAAGFAAARDEHDRSSSPFRSHEDRTPLKEAELER